MSLHDVNCTSLSNHLFKLVWRYKSHDGAGALKTTLILGSSGAGKTAMFSRVCSRQFHVSEASIVAC